MRTGRGIYNQSARPQRLRRPFWIPAGLYYLISALLAFLVYIGAWSLLIEGGEPAASWVAAVPSLFFLAGAVSMREIFLRRARRRFLAVQRQLDESMSSARPAGFGPGPLAPMKLSSKQNAELVSRIKRKSDAAKELMGVARGHLEVFELCAEYLELNRNQIEGANPGSPRLQDLRKSREFVKKLHHFHLLSWAELETKALTRVATDCDTISGKTSHLRDALRVIESALTHYPNDPSLTESDTAVRNLLFSVEISSRIEIAEREAFLGEYESAVRTLNDAIEYIEADVRPDGLKEELRRRLELEVHRFTNHSRIEWDGRNGDSGKTR